MLVTPDADLFPGFSGLTPAFVGCDGDTREPDLGQLPRKPASRAPTTPTGSMPARAAPTSTRWRSRCTRAQRTRSTSTQELQRRGPQRLYPAPL